MLDRGRWLAAAHRPDVRPAGPPLLLRLGHVVAEAGRPGRRRRRPAADRRGAAQPRPPRRQPRRRRAGAAARRRHGGHDAVRRRAGWADGARGLRPWETTRLDGAGPAADRGDRHAVPARPAAEPAGRRRRRSDSPWRGRARSTECCGSPVTRSSSTGSEQVADRLTVDTALLHLGGVQFPITGPLRYSMTAREARRAVPAAPPAHRGCRPLRGLVALPGGQAGGRARVRPRAGGDPRPPALAGGRCRDRHRGLRAPRHSHYREAGFCGPPVRPLVP